MSGQHKHSSKLAKAKSHPWEEKSVGVVPMTVQNALRDAMKAESIPPTDFNDLLWIMAQESSGKVNARNGGSTARGLYQLLRAQYGLNPNGEASFGNAVEECRGGIRYIYGRYHTAHTARVFWQSHHWY
jgi:SLT domain-containing protein